MGCTGENRVRNGVKNLCAILKHILFYTSLPENQIVTMFHKMFHAKIHAVSL